MKDKFKFVLNKELENYTDDMFTATRHQGIEDVFIITWDDKSVSYESFPYYEENDIERYVNNGDWIIVD